VATIEYSKFNMIKTIVGVDLAKKVIKLYIYTNKKGRYNTKMTPNEFTCWLAIQS